MTTPGATDFKAPTERTALRRLPARGSYDRERIDSILDEGLVCHVGFVVDGQPFVIPTAYARDDDRLILHGSVLSRMLRRLAEGVEICVTVTLVDGLVLARSAFHHSMNYRSVMIFGRAAPITDPAEKRRALDALVEHLVPGRAAEARSPNAKEEAATEVVVLPLAEASAKVREGPPQDAPKDLSLDVWAGVIPLAATPGEALAAPDLAPHIEAPDYVAGYRRPGSRDRRNSRGKS